MAASVKAYALADGALSDRLLADTRFVKEKRRKIREATPAKFFAPLTTMSSQNQNTRGAVPRPAP